METLKDFLKPELIWFLIGVIMLLMEFTVPGLIIFFFGVGACVVSVVCFFAEPSINAQLLIFIAASILSLLLLRNRLKAIFIGHSSDKQDASSDLNEFAGQRAVVIKKITPQNPGKVEFHGTNWNAESDEEIEQGTAVEITAKNNLTLKVKRL
ncbi:MAG: NfeD family protein [Sedimentisphaerales bacterium]|nr:NfeD family protein [Sedimentisphaerales bacterium]